MKPVTVINEGTIDDARRHAAKIVAAFKLAEAEVETCTKALSEAKLKVTQLRGEKEAAKIELKSIAAWSVPGLTDESDHFPEPVLRAMGFEERKR